jgi:hypothetical protein
MYFIVLIYVENIAIFPIFLDLKVCFRLNLWLAQAPKILRDATSHVIVITAMYFRYVYIFDP